MDEANELNDFRVGLGVPDWRCAAHLEEWGEWCIQAFPGRPSTCVRPVLSVMLNEVAIKCEGQMDKCRIYVNFVRFPAPEGRPPAEKRKWFTVHYLIFP